MTQRRAFLPIVEFFDLRILPGQLLAPATDVIGLAGRGDVESLDSVQLLTWLDPSSSNAERSQNEPPAPAPAESSPGAVQLPAAAEGTLALNGLAQDLGEEADLLTQLLQAGSRQDELIAAGFLPGEDTAHTGMGCGLEVAACGHTCSTESLAHHSCSAAAPAAPAGDMQALLQSIMNTLHHATTSDDGTAGADIHTPHDHVPDFGANPTIVSIRSGNWSNPATWSEGRVPSEGDVVAVQRATTVTYDVVASATLRTLVVTPGGRLRFRTTVNTRLMVGNFLVREGGRLEVGTAADPVRPAVKAEIVIANQPLDTNFDPRQYGTGLLVWGQATMHGAVKDSTFLRLARAPRQGDTTLLLQEAVSGWRPGDRLIVPPTTGVYFTELNTPAELATEELTVRSVTGNVVTLTRPLAYNHEGAFDAAGNLTFLPHVGNLTRNVVIRSADPQGTRGHTMFTHHAGVDLRYVQFKDLGRTNGGPLDSTVFDEDGNPVHIGTNQIGRYAFHAHHLWGPENPLDEGYQYELLGNVIDGARKWGMAFHGSHYGLIQDNIVYDVQEAGIATEDGSESFNLFEHNFIVRVGGSEYDLADGFWLGGPRNYFRYNVVASTFNSNHSPTVNTGTGYHLDALVGPIREGSALFPLRRGADMLDPTQTERLPLPTLPMLEFRGNEGYAMDIVFWNDHHVGPSSAEGGHYIQDLRAWGVWNGAANAYGGATTFDGVTVRKINRVGFLQQSTDGRIILRNVDIQDASPDVMGVHFLAGAGPEIELLVENGFLRTAENVVVTLASSTGAVVEATYAKRTILSNVHFEAPAGLPLRTITAAPTTYGQDSIAPVVLNTIHVVNYEGRSGDNFQVFFREQDPDYLVPYEGDLPEYPGAVRYSVPERGLTNAQAWARYQRAIAGAVAPCLDDTSRPEVAGYTCGS